MPYLRAATDAPFGAMPYDRTLRISRYNKDNAAARIFIGDFVILEADGSVAVAAAGDALLGVAAMGSAASTAEANFLVYDHPDQLFVVQEDSDSAFMAQTNVGNNADILATTGDTTTGRSAHELDMSNAAAATAQLRIVELHPVETSFATAAGNQRKVIVRINEHLLAGRGDAGV